MALSLAVAVLMLAGKITAYVITGSTAILSDAAESIVHIAATGFAGFSLWYSRRPADYEHPYGHGKMAYFSAGFEGGLIFAAALYIIYEAIRALIVGPELRQLDCGLGITASLAAVNLALGLFLVYEGNKHKALVLIANGKHVLTDVWTSVAVVVGVGAVYFSGITWFDPAIAIVAALNIILSGAKLMRDAITGLLDRADPRHTAAILDALKTGVDDETISNFHQLRHRLSNDVVWVEVHMLVPGELSTREAHRRATEVEKRVRDSIADYEVHVTAHVEPTEHSQAHPKGHQEPKDIFT